MAAPVVNYLRRLTAWPALDGRAPTIGHRQQLLVESGGVLMLLGAIVLTQQLGGTRAEHMLLSFLLWLLGMSLTMLSIVAEQFPRVAAAGATLAIALRRYLLGGI